MEALQADIARRINKRQFVDSASNSESDSGTSIEELLRPAKRIRCRSKPTVPPTKNLSFPYSDVQGSPSSSASSYTIIGDLDEGAYSSDIARNITTIETSRDEGKDLEDSNSATSSTESLLETDAGTSSSEEDDDDRKSRPLYADTATSIDSHTESSSSSDEDSDGDAWHRNELDETGDSDSSSDDSTSSESSSSSHRSISFPRLSSGTTSPQHTPNPLMSSIQAAKPARRRPGGATGRESTDLKSRLNALLPQMQKANQQLEIERQAGRLGERDIEKLEEEGMGYVEMDLGLGVLEEKREVEVGDQVDSEGGGGGKERREVEGEHALPALVPTAVKEEGNVGIEILEEGP